MLTLRFYRLLSLCIHPFVYLWLLKRVYEKKENKARLSERLGCCAVRRPDMDVIWIHAASVGESMSVLPFVRQLCDGFPSVFVVVTTGTVSSAEMIASRLPPRAVHQYVPVDTVIAVDRFLNHWKPAVAFFTESELWPCLAERTAARCPLMLLNARISEKSTARWQKFPVISRELMQCFQAIYPQEVRYVDVFKELGASDIRFIGNLKYDAPPLPDDPVEAGKLLEHIGDRTLWVAASIHLGEEDMLIAAHKALKEQYNDALTVIIPRHTRNGPVFEKVVKEHNLTVALRSRNEFPCEDTDIYIADTMGEMGVFFRITSIVFVGGSFVPIGGHNLLEPARLDCAIFFGPHTENFTVIAEELLREKAAVQVKNEEECISCLIRLCEDTHAADRLAGQAKKNALKKNTIIADHIDMFRRYLPQVESEHVELKENISESEASV